MRYVNWPAIAAMVLTAVLFVWLATAVSAQSFSAPCGPHDRMVKLLTGPKHAERLSFAATSENGQALFEVYINHDRGGRFSITVRQAGASVSCLIASGSNWSAKADKLKVPGEKM